MDNVLEELQDSVVVCLFCERQSTILTTRNGDEEVIICTHCGFEEENERDRAED